MSSNENIIQVKNNVRFGKPCIRNTRITVSDVLGWLASGMSQSEIIDEYPELTKADIKACLSYV